MPTVALTELIDRAKAAADMRDNFVTPTQWEHWATQERYALDLFIARSGWPTQILTEVITVVGNEEGRFLLDDDPGIMALVAVHQVKGSSYRMLRHTNSSDFQPDSRNTGDATEYRVLWTNSYLYLDLYPRPRAGDVYQVSYVPHPKKLRLAAAIDSETEAANVFYPMGWEERIVLGMARRALIKEESSTQAIDSELMLLDSRIEEAAWGRVMNDVPAVRNSDYTTYGWVDRYSYPPYLSWQWL